MPLRPLVEARARPLARVPRAIPPRVVVDVGMARPRPPRAVEDDMPRPIREEGAGVEYLDDGLDDVGGLSTKDVSVVLSDVR